MNIRNTVFFEGCNKKVIAMAVAAFKRESREMNSDKKAKALLRMKKELKIITNNGFSYEYYLLKIIMEHSITKERLVIIGGQMSYSYVAYLLGITTIDPFDRDYELEMLLDYHHDRNPYMLIIGSSDYKESLIKFIREIFGEETISVDEMAMTIGAPMNSFDCLRLGYRESWLIEKAEEIMHEKSIESNKKFKTVKDSIFLPQYAKGFIPTEKTLGVIELLHALDSKEQSRTVMKQQLLFLFDSTHEGLLRALAAKYGKGITEANLQDIHHNRILTRDDLYKMGLSLFGKEKEAYDFMTKIRKGRGKDPRYQETLDRKGVPYEYRDKLKLVQYVVSEGSLIAEAQLILFLVSQPTWDLIGD